ncbi:serine/threonine protein phosphatase 2B catalytic subunit, putative [Entamoeba invadens IP1]|uniref:Serine/threonine-protein phosphatase n=1 Tax=Entamoeba invadens IP1 TaxID=370355 RepID=A0A0A1U2M2_ENTIV|nr:serine/threonine protein phosphatase 2B catalytic subunit, putative [Entamoeba invadens IP1]ELP88307.1 serine/threonine protein phosphatase 2B catalytic subunit, putative [Entamoeba invadens IP1]|eukprot:XP_004255078.1 serine/threonine protein phosphatase 2B catalytic subunit, putative [Entamoeba invadens IP1]
MPKKQLVYPKTLDPSFLDVLHNHFMHDGVLSKECVTTLLFEVQKVLKSEPNLLRIKEDTLIYGDYHGQYFDCIEQRDDEFWTDTAHCSLYLGDYVDRGTMSCEVVITLLFMKLITPNKVYLLRGNHETRKMTERFGFKSECMVKYDFEIYNLFISTFECLPLAATITRGIGEFFCCHGGISPDLNKIEEIDKIYRFTEVPSKGLFCDLLWSDPFVPEPGQKNKEITTLHFVKNVYRGCSYIYGVEAMKDFLKNNELNLLIRGHQCFDSGIFAHTFGFPEQTPLALTVFGATRYQRNSKAGCVMIEEKDVKIRRYDSTTIQKHFEKDFGGIFVDSIFGLGNMLQEIGFSLFELCYYYDDDLKKCASDEKIAEDQFVVFDSDDQTSGDENGCDDSGGSDSDTSSSSSGSSDSSTQSSSDSSLEEPQDIHMEPKSINTDQNTIVPQISTVENHPKEEKIENLQTKPEPLAVPTPISFLNDHLTKLAISSRIVNLYQTIHHSRTNTLFCLSKFKPPQSPLPQKLTTSKSIATTRPLLCSLSITLNIR